MRTVMILLLMVCPFFIYSQKDLKKTLVNKHWGTNYGGNEKHQYLFYKIPRYNEKLYQWGTGYMEGFELYENGSGIELHNVLCSSESDPKTDCVWKLVADSLFIETIYHKKLFIVKKINRKKILVTEVYYELIQNN